MRIQKIKINESDAATLGAAQKIIRWNYCQRIIALLFRSAKTDAELAQKLREILIAQNIEK